jgi:hypothetical protein
MKLLITNLNRLRNLSIISMLSLSVISCGGGGNSGISGTGINNAGISGTGITSGPITGFGSVFVNGVKYEIDSIEGSQNFKVDDSPGAFQDDLKIGMVVQISWTSFDNGTTEADTLVYDDSVEGPITSTVEPVTGKPNQKIFTVMGTEVVVDSASTSFHDSSVSTGGINFDNIAQGDVIEVSGFIVDSSGKVRATSIEKRSVLVAGSIDTPVEMRGVVTSLVANNFTLNGIAVTFDPATVEFDDLPNGLSDGLTVEVKGFYDADNNSIQAREIEREDSEGGIGSADPDLSVSLQGVIAGPIDKSEIGTWRFTVNGVSVELVNSAIPTFILTQLAEGQVVGVEGRFVNNVLVADQVEIKGNEYEAIVASAPNLTANTLELTYPNVGGVTPGITTILFRLNNQTIIEDEIDQPITLSDIASGDDVKIEASETNNERIVITLQRQRNEFSSYEIAGDIDAIVPNETITIDGLIFTLSDTVFPDPALTAWPNLQIGSMVELEDNNRDGIIDSVSVYIP